MAKKLKYLIIHCTDTPEGREVTPEDIILWHTGPKEDGHRGWSRPGYSDMIMLDGSLKNLMAFDMDGEVDNWEISNGARGFNSEARHIVYVGGGKGKDTRTRDQERALMVYCEYTRMRHPDILIGGHNQFSNKYCPSFNVEDWLLSLGFSEKNILKGKVV